MGTKERHDRERQAVTDSILDAARELFLAEGYPSVSIRKIAERIEYSPAAIYSYYPSKDDIFLALAKEGFHRLDAKVRAAMVSGDPLENVRACWWAFYEFSKEQPEYFLLMFVDRSVPRITQQWEGFEFLQQLLTNAVTAIQAAIDAGAFPKTMSPNAAMHMLWAGLIGPAVVGIRHRLASGEDYDALARDVLNVTIAGLQTGVETTFVSCKCADPSTLLSVIPSSSRDEEQIAGAPVPAGATVMNRSVPHLRISVAALILGSSLIVAGCGAFTTTEAAPETTVPAVVDVATVTITTGAIESVLEISGTLTPLSRVAVKPKLPGTIERMLVDIGDAVTKGQTIATIDRREIDAQADAAVATVAVGKAALEAAEASLANAILEHDRATNLFEKGALPRQRLDAAQTARRSAIAQRDLAVANLAQTDAALRRAREVQRNATITSPVTGYVVERNYDAGAIPGDLPVVVVADMRQMKLEAGVSELEAGRLRVGLKANVSVAAKPGQAFEGQLAAIAPEVDKRNRHFMIDVRVPNTNRALLSGMYATARIIEATAAHAVLVPRDAVMTKDGKRMVQKIQGDTIATVVVTEGLSDGTRVQIVSGLAAGDIVMADARRQIPAGSKVRGIAAGR